MNNNRKPPFVDRLQCALLAAVLLAALLPRAAHAGRPVATEDAGTAAFKSLELETGLEYAWQGQAPGDFAPLVTLNAGVAEGVEFSLDVPYLVLRSGSGDSSGFGDLALGSKIQLLNDEEEQRAVAIKPLIKFATGDADRGLGSGDEDLGVVLAATQDWYETSMSASFGYGWVGGAADSQLRDVISYGVSIGHPVTERLSLVSEIFFENAEDSDPGVFAHHHFNPLAGFTYEVSDRLVADAALVLSLERHEEPAYAALAGFTYALGGW